MILNKPLMLKIRMELDLVDRWRDLTSLEDPVEFLRQVIADTNRLHQPLSLEFFHLLPLLLVVLLLITEEWRMNKIPSVQRQ